MVEAKKILKYENPRPLSVQSILTQVPRERKSANLQLISDVCDLTIPASALGYANLDDGIVGLAGTLSSVIGAYLQWLKTSA